MLPKQKKSQCTAVFLILLCAYILVFCGFSSTDDEQLFIAITENLSYGREYAALPLFGNDRLQGQTGGVEPLHSIVGVPFYKAAQYFNLGKAQVLYLLPVVISALTGALLVCIAEFKSAPPKTAAFLGLVYGLGTIALPYARMNFREQLAALLITAAVLFLELGKDALIHTRKQFLYPFFSLIILGLAVLTKITTVVLIPFFIFLYLTKHQFRVFENYTRLVKNALVVVVLFILAGFTMWRILPADGLSRYTLRFFNYLSYTLPRLPHNHLFSNPDPIACQPISQTDKANGLDHIHGSFTHPRSCPGAHL